VTFFNENGSELAVTSGEVPGLGEKVILVNHRSGASSWKVVSREWVIGAADVCGKSLTHVKVVLVRL